MKTKTIIFLIRKVDSLTDELMKFNNMSDLELEILVTLYNHTFDMLKTVVNCYWLSTNVNQLRQELNSFQLNIYSTIESKMIEKYYSQNYWLN
jgi:hypothetical protein